MAWVKQNIEKALEAKLKDEYPEAEADKYWSYYLSARNKLVSQNIYQSIGVKRPDLSDHGENHIMDVLENAYKLLENDIDNIYANELYFICMIILFHDVGNLTEEREKHHDEDVIREIYEIIRGEDLKDFPEERKLVPEVASKHSGKAGNGSRDTIQELSISLPFIFGKVVHSKWCAGLLRFADELAEGPHRTSIFMNHYYDYPYEENSIIYHKYAEITKIDIDKVNERVCLTYNFCIPAKDGIISDQDKKEFIDLFEFTIKRMLKLEAERKYCKYYCTWLEKFKKTQVTFNYFIENETAGKKKSIGVAPDGATQISLDDLVLPEGDPNFLDKNPSLSPSAVFDNINSELNGRQ